MLTRMVTDSAKYAGEDDGFANESEGFVKFAGSGESYEAVGVNAAGTAKTAGRFLSFVDDKSIGESLGVGAKNSFAVAKALLKLMRMRNGASLGTIAAAGTFV